MPKKNITQAMPERLEKAIRAGLEKGEVIIRMGLHPVLQELDPHIQGWSVLTSKSAKYKQEDGDVVTITEWWVGDNMKPKVSNEIDIAVEEIKKLYSKYAFNAFGEIK